MREEMYYEATLTCKCEKPTDLFEKRGRFICLRCHREVNVVKLTPMSRVVSDFESDVFRGFTEALPRELLTRLMSLEEAVINATSEMEKVREESEAERNLYYKKRSEAEAVIEENRILREKIASLKSQLASAEEETEKWRRHYTEIKDRARTSQEELVSLKEENGRLRSENARMSSVNIREVTDMFLEFMTGIYNASLDYKDRESLAEMIRARTAKVIMNAQAHGLTIDTFERGHGYGNKRIDIDTLPTNEFFKDGTVAKCNKFGCSFRNDCEPEIPASVTVWVRCKDTNHEEPVTETCDTVVTLTETKVHTEENQTTTDRPADNLPTQGGTVATTTETPTTTE